MFYNPIVRTFCKVRRVLMRVLGVSRESVHPQSLLLDLIPVSQRQEVWQALQLEGLIPDRLERNPFDAAMNTLTVLKTAGSLAWMTQSWFGLLSAVPLGIAADRLTRHQAVHFPLGLETVGELVMHLTSCREHLQSGYRWSRGDLAYRVRFVVAESLGLSIHEVQEHCTLVELGAE